MRFWSCDLSDWSKCCHTISRKIPQGYYIYLPNMKSVPYSIGAIAKMKCGSGGLASPIYKQASLAGRLITLCMAKVISSKTIILRRYMRNQRSFLIVWKGQCSLKIGFMYRSSGTGSIVLEQKVIYSKVNKSKGINVMWNCSTFFISVRNSGWPKATQI